MEQQIEAFNATLVLPSSLKSPISSLSAIMRKLLSAIARAAATRPGHWATGLVDGWALHVKG